MSKLFYVYLIIDPTNGEVIYTGKGSGSRMYKHWKDALNRSHYNLYLSRKLQSIATQGFKGPIYVKLVETTDENLCFALERFFIATIGRGKNGTLCNLTDGGEGISGLKHTRESRIKMSRTSNGFAGVCQRKNRKNPWMSRINCIGYRMHIGFYPTKEDAALAYNAKAIELYGGKAKLNIIPDSLPIAV